MNESKLSKASCSVKKTLKMLAKITAAFAVFAMMATVASAQVDCAENGAPSGCFQTGAPTLLQVYKDDGDGVFGPGDVPITGGVILQNGDLVFYQVTLFHSGQASLCAFREGGITITTPDNVAHVVTPVGGVPIICDVAGQCPPGSVPSVVSLPQSYIVNLADDGTDPDALLNGRLQARGTYANGKSYFDADCEEAAGSATISLEPVISCVSITKQVACKQVGGACQTLGASATGYKVGAQNPTFCYSMVVSNCSTKRFIVTSLSDDKLGDLLAAFIAANGGSDTLATNQAVTVTAEATHAATTVNEVTVSGVTDTSTPLQASDTDSAQANVELAAASCSVTADPETVPAGATTPVTYCVTVNNNGDTALLNITITGSKGETYPVVASLAAGQSTQVCAVAQVTVAPDSCDPIQNNVTVQSTTGGECPVLVPSQCDKTIATECAPTADIIKQVACYDATVGCDEFGDVAYGVKTATQCPVFCYKITITNTSSAVTLNDIVVTDPDLDLSGCNFPTSLAPNTSASCTVTGVERCNDLKNTATLTGSGGSPVTGVVEWDDADVFIKSAAITCVKEVSLDGETYASSVSIPDDGTEHAIWYRITVSNISDAGVTLGNIVVTDPMLGACDLASQVPATLASGASFAVGCVVTQTCNGVDIGNTATVTAEVVAADQVKCVKDFEGKAITVAHECSSVVRCIPQPKEGCRTTGGGKQYASENQTCPLDVRYVTHGGQVGAPFGYAGAPTITNCETGEGTGFWNPCIRGEYQHVRHMKGGRRANFHAASNGHINQFDSLACACLPCDSFETSSPWANGTLTCHPADRTYTNSGDVVEGLCNPGNRECGPEPRRAAANKIAFSGVGSYTESKGKKVANSVVFRVDIEDRGEPGNAHAIGASGKNKKIDRYRMRMWKITGDPDSAYNRALRVAVAVTNAADERVLSELPCGFGATPEPDIDDGGDLDRGNRQLHPTTGARCD